MNWYLAIKYVHILAVALTIGGMFARQLVRASAKKSENILVVASLTRAAIRIDRGMVVPASNAMILVGIILAVINKWPIIGFLQGAQQNWLLVSNILLIVLLAIIFTVFIPFNKQLEAALQAALSTGSLTPELSAALDDPKNRLAHYVEEVTILVIAALMVLKPF